MRGIPLELFQGVRGSLHVLREGHGPVGRRVAFAVGRQQMSHFFLLLLSFDAYSANDANDHHQNDGSNDRAENNQGHVFFLQGFHIDAFVDAL